MRIETSQTGSLSSETLYTKWRVIHEEYKMQLNVIGFIKWGRKERGDQLFQVDRKKWRIISYSYQQCVLCPLSLP